MPLHLLLFKASDKSRARHVLSRRARERHVVGGTNALLLEEYTLLYFRRAAARDCTKYKERVFSFPKELGYAID